MPQTSENKLAISSGKYHFHMKNPENRKSDANFVNLKNGNLEAIWKILKKAIFMRFDTFTKWSCKANLGN